jgi:hypothetical protein
MVDTHLLPSAKEVVVPVTVRASLVGRTVLVRVSAPKTQVDCWVAVDAYSPETLYAVLEGVLRGLGYSENDIDCVLRACSTGLPIHHPRYYQLETGGERVSSWADGA